MLRDTMTTLFGAFFLVYFGVCLPYCYGKDVYTLHNSNGTDLPGPAMFYNVSLTRGVFQFEFRTLVSNALVLYQDSAGYKEYFALLLRQGQLYVSFYVGSGSRQEETLVSPTILDDFEWHWVRVARNKTMTAVTVDHDMTKVFKTDKETSKFKTFLQLGGFPPDSYGNTYKISYRPSLVLYVGDVATKRHGFFSSCVRNIKFGLNATLLRQLNDVASQRMHVTNGCRLTFCKNVERYCKNYGQCSMIENTTSAQCVCGPGGFTGKRCDEDINECLLKPPVCGSERVECVNNPGSFHCQCKTGYKQEGNRDCADIDECVESDKAPCHSLARCNNTQGSFTCTCGHGYHGDGINCTDINECLLKPSVCGNERVECVNNPGSFYCQCKTGYKQEGNRDCADIDECVESDKAPCHSHARCNNTQGSFTCTCSTGYHGDGRNCTDINECKRESPNCHQNADCMNTEGSYNCECKAGYTGNGFKNCTVIDQCLDEPCHKNATCVNAINSYKCNCLNGFTGDGKKSCTVIDMCAQPNTMCHSNAKCSNGQNPGSYSCKCLPGFSGDGLNNCTDINECINASKVCASFATCINNHGSYKCRCQHGYIGDGYLNCTYDQCTNLPCYPGVACTMNTTTNTYVCDKCPEPLEGNGKICSLKANQDAEMLNVSIKLTNVLWHEDLKNKSSVIFKTQATKLINQISEAYSNEEKFSNAIVNEFRRGSVIAEVLLIFSEAVENALETLTSAMKAEKFGTLFHETDDKPTSDEKKRVSTSDGNEKIAGLDKNAFIGIVVAASVLVFSVIVLTAVYIYRRRTNQRTAIITENKVVNECYEEKQRIL